MGMTIRELADELNISKTAINKKIDKSFKNKYFSKVGNKFVISEVGVKLIREKFQEKTERKNRNGSETGSQTENEEVVFLKLQLESKDIQINNLHKLLEQQQILTLQANKKIETLEFEKEENKKDDTKTNVEHNVNKKENLFTKLFK